MTSYSVSGQGLDFEIYGTSFIATAAVENLDWNGLGIKKVSCIAGCGVFRVRGTVQ